MIEGAVEASDDTVAREPGPPIRSLAKGLAALDILRRDGELRTTDLASQLAVDKGAASRILQTLAQAGYATRVQGRRYVAGPKLDLATPGSRQPRHSIRASAQPLLNRLASQTGEAVYLGVLVDDQVLYIDKVVPANTLIVDRPIPTLSPRCCSAIGKLFTALYPLPIPAVLPGYTAHTITDPTAYREEIRRIARLGYSWDNEELNLGVRCVAAPLRDSDGHVIAALSLAAPSARLAATQIDSFAQLTVSIAESFVAG